MSNERTEEDIKIVTWHSKNFRFKRKINFKRDTDRITITPRYRRKAFVKSDDGFILQPEDIKALNSEAQRIYARQVA